MRPEDIVAFDQAHLWHPYAPTPAPMDPLPVASASGVHLTLTDGRRLIDGMSSWWAAAHGHSHPALVSAAHEQIDRMSHVMFGGLTHEPAVKLGERLVRLTGLDKVFYADSGSVSVEVAVKMALQYQRGMGHLERNKLLTWRGGYHGDTFAPMSVCDPEGGMHALWRGTIAEQKFAPAPPAGTDFNDYIETFESCIDETVAAVIIEPVVQGAGGMRFHSPDLVAEIRQLCTKHGILFIADEIATGFGRTGSIFACQAAGVKPDIMCVGKALTGGFMTLAATLATNEVAEAIQTPEGGGALMHGPTFMGNPLACAVADTAVELIEAGDWQHQVPRIEAELRAGLEPLSVDPRVAEVRVLGAIGVVEMKQPVDMRATTEAAVAEGVWLRPFGKLIYCMPPFISTTEQVTQICRAIRAAVEANEEYKK
ncbi:Adenosylmethionine-8-amino-7-oxononanoate aminotransferase [Corynebacterium kalinowskii]|uniref:Adenosylmethionine-8-amino-7-oxononanoate aminotransferase n=2 Tax=Corynebacterium kalinowskii TaxID=2675216 RepID=A0A6B8VKD2_9CORY|nr:adenosylmethionine--8-amino-7-oxononanoate transaminase [Corynebacterium kalinowskii]QGU01934.1 Adenosylmethionine-8-amino-7-oxononanoate aminotransferase [Corynebacterium kalinowskii]